MQERGLKPSLHSRQAPPSTPQQEGSLLTPEHSLLHPGPPAPPPRGIPDWSLDLLPLPLSTSVSSWGCRLSGFILKAQSSWASPSGLPKPAVRAVSQCSPHPCHSPQDHPGLRLPLRDSGPHGASHLACPCRSAFLRPKVQVSALEGWPVPYPWPHPWPPSMPAVRVCVAGLLVLFLGTAPLFQKLHSSECHFRSFAITQPGGGSQGSSAQP